MDLRIQNLSYSSLLQLHACPRKFQLQKLNAEVDLDEDMSSSVTFSFGHTVGVGVATLLETNSLDTAIFKAFLEWKPELFADNPRQAKSFWLAVLALQKFHDLRETGFLEEWELMYFEGKPAIELSFIILLPNGFKYRGFVDAVLRNKETGEIMVLECKTTSASTVYSAQYKNSAQAVGYSVVLDHLCPDLSSYQVLYLPYKTKAREFEPMLFNKSYLSRALWLRELLLDCDTIMMYEEAGIYPMHGESCLDFFRECEYFNLCTLPTERLTSPLNAEEEAALLKEHTTFQFQVPISALIEAQLAKDI